jgi:hypothetical protein
MLNRVKIERRFTSSGINGARKGVKDIEMVKSLQLAKVSEE